MCGMNLLNFLRLSVFLTASLTSATPFNLEARQGGACAATCCLSGFAVVNGQTINFNNVRETNAAANPGANAAGVTTSITNILDGCSIGVVETCQCAGWSITDTSGCGTSRTVTFANCAGGGGPGNGGGGGGGRPGGGGPGGPGGPGGNVLPIA